MDKIERRLDATTKLIQAGMKMLVKTQQENRETARAVNALIEAQMRTESKLERLIESLSRRKGNGRAH